MDLDTATRAEFDDILPMRACDVVQELNLDFLILMNEDVPKTAHSSHAVCQVGTDLICIR